MEGSVEAAANKRQKVLREITKVIADRRVLLQKSADEFTFNAPPHAFQDELQDDVIRERFSNEFLRLVQKKEQMYKDEMDRMQQQVLPAMQRIIERYSEQFGVAPAMELDPAEATPESTMETTEEQPPASQQPSSVEPADADDLSIASEVTRQVDNRENSCGN